MTEDSLTIRQMCDAFDVTPRTLRFYEAKELLFPIRDGQKRLFTRRDHDACALVSDWEALTVTPLLGAEERLRHIGDELARGVLGIGKVRAAGQDGEIRRIDRRSFHLHEHLIPRGLGEFGFHDLDGQFAVGERAEELFASGQGIASC